MLPRKPIRVQPREKEGHGGKVAATRIASIATSKYQRSNEILKCDKNNNKVSGGFFCFPKDEDENNRV